MEKPQLNMRKALAKMVSGAVLCGLLLPMSGYLLWQGSSWEVVIALSSLAVVLTLVVLGIQTWHATQHALDTFNKMRDEAAAALQEQEHLLERATHEAAMIELANTEKTRFWSAASHDLRQPLHALGLYSALLRKASSEQARNELLEHMGSCVSSLTSLFDAILGVTHAETAHINAKPAAVPLQRVIDQVLIQLRPSAENKGLQLRVVPTSLWAHADPAIIERILGNLLSNAIRYTQEGKILVGVRRRHGKCVLIVADTGIGLSGQDQNRIFDDFFQVSNPERQRDKGYGLGLSTVHRLCAALNYDIEVQSIPSRGSLFSVTLPLDLPTRKEATEDNVQTLESDLHVLFVEDDGMVRDAMNRLLTDWGLQVAMCATGDEAIAILSQKIDKRWHVLLDYALADNETGFQVADRIRSVIGEGPTIALVTGEEYASVALGAKERGITVLRKPLKPIRLRALLHSQQLNESVL